MNTRAQFRANTAVRRRRFNLFVAGMLLVSVALLVVVYLQWDSGEPSTSGQLDADPIATFALLDVGQAASAAIVTSDGHSMVYDFGLSAGDTDDTIIPFLEHHGADQIDFAILSHPHQDHLGGLPGLLDVMPPEHYVEPALETTNQTYAQSLEMIEELQPEVTLARQGQTFTLGSNVEMEILWPTDDLLLDSDGNHELNDNSTVVRVDIGDVSILLTGDLEREGENTLVETKGEEIDVDILQVSHHGSNSSSQARFLQAANPAAGFISAGQDNQYGHPHREVMQRLREQEIDIYRTDVDGTITVETDGTTWQITTDRTAP